MAIPALPSPGLGLVREEEIAKAFADVGKEKSLPFTYTYVQHATGRTDAPAAYQVLAAFGLLAASAPADLMFDGLPGQPIYANLWTLAVGQSGNERKTTVISSARRMLEAAAPHVIGARPSSAEAFETSFGAQPSQILIISDMGEFLAQAQGEANYYRKVKSKFVDVYDCGPIFKRNAKKEAIVCPAPRFSIMAAVNPSFLEEHTERADWTGGYMSRHLTMFAERERHLKVRAADQSDWQQRLTNYLATAAALGSASPCVGLEPDALETFTYWSDVFEQRVLAQRGPLSGHASRVPAFALKLALLAAWDLGYWDYGSGVQGPRSGNPWLLRLDHIYFGISIVELHWRSIVQIAEYSISSKDIRDRKLVLGCLREGYWTSLGEILRRAPSVGLSKRVNEVLSTLVSAGEAKSRPGPSETMYSLPSAAERLARQQASVVPFDQLPTTNPLLQEVDENGAPRGQGGASDQNPLGPRPVEE